MTAGGVWGSGSIDVAAGDWLKLCDGTGGVWLKEGNIGGRLRCGLMPSRGASVSRWRSMKVCGGCFGEGGASDLTSRRSLGDGVTSAWEFDSLDVAVQPFCSCGGVGAVPSGGWWPLLPFSFWQLSSSLRTHRDGGKFEAS